MSKVIREYYKKAHTLPTLIEQKMLVFEKHPDIMKKFEQWLRNREYKVDGAVSVFGYTAKTISELSPYLRGEGAIVLLMELRDNPEKAKKRISTGFKKK